MSTFPLKLTWSGTTVTKAYDREALAEAPGKEPIRLSAGDAACFVADVAHSYENPGRTATLVHNVIVYAR